MDPLIPDLRGGPRALSDWFFARGGGESLGPMPPDQKLLVSIVVFASLWLIRLLLLRLVLPKIEEARARYRWRRVTQYTFVGLAAFLVLEIWFPHFENLATYFGLLSAGVAIALRDPIANLVGWAYLVWRRPFGIGDRVEIGTTAGDVVDMRLFEFSLNEIGNWVEADQSTGRVVHVPNQLVFSRELANYTRGFAFIWNEVRVPLSMDSDWRAAQDILKRIADEQAQEVLAEAQPFIEQGAEDDYLIFYRTLTPAVYTAVEDRGIVLTVRHLVHPRQRRGATHRMWQAILEAFEAHDSLRIAWPTQHVEWSEAGPRRSAAESRRPGPQRGPSTDGTGSNAPRGSDSEEPRA